MKKYGIAFDIQIKETISSDALVADGSGYELETALMIQKNMQEIEGIENVEVFEMGGDDNEN